ncbi:MAG: sensor histidine kinase [Pseudonocardiales bacterium]
MTALKFGGVPGVAVLGGDLSQLRRRGGWWRMRDWRLGTKLTAVLLVPLLLAGVLGGLRVADSLREAGQLRVVARQVALAQLVGVVVHDVQRERQLVLAEMISPGAVDGAALSSQIQRVDIGITALRSGDSGAADLGSAAPESVAYQDVLTRLSSLRKERFAPGPAADRVAVGYTEAIAVLLELHRAMLGGASDPLRGQAAGLAALAIAKEQLSVQHAVLLAALLSGSLSPEQLGVLRTSDVRFDAAIDAFDDAVPPEQRQRYADTVTGDAVAARQRLLDGALSEGELSERALGAGPQNVLAGWDVVAIETIDRFRQVETALLDELLTDTTTLGERASHAAIRDAAVVVALLVLAVALLVVVVRSLLRPLRALRTHAFTVADRRLPDAVEHLRSADNKIGETTVDPVPVYSQEEVGQVARAFDTVHVQAVRLAAEQAMLRSNINDIFLNLAGRSQHLVERQLKLIGKLECGEQDPELLSNLCQLDHLAIRMRRNSENLLVLAGGELLRDAESGSSVLDMLRAAVSEIAEYDRVTLRRPPAAIVSGTAAGDLAHLISELLDNATSASPPDNSVTLRSGITEEGDLLVEIIDCGTGLPPGELHAINERLAAPPAPDASVSRQMGLFVVSRLAARHNISVRLRQRRGDFGITAAVLVPSTLVSAESPAEPLLSGSSARDGAFGTAWSGTNAETLRADVVEGAADPDRFSPSSIGGLMTVRRRRPRTAEEEWFELFGHEEPEHGPDRVPASGSGTVAAVPESGTVVAVPQQAREEIFESVSAWFRQEQSVSPGQAAPEQMTPDDQIDETSETSLSSPGLGSLPVPTALEWRSAGDEGWYAAKALGTRVDFEVTTAGLPKRQPGAQLIPGSAGPSRPGPAPSSNRLARTAEDVRGRLSSYQQGLRHGRHSRISLGDRLARTHARQGYPDEGSRHPEEGLQ